MSSPARPTPFLVSSTTTGRGFESLVAGYDQRVPPFKAQPIGRWDVDANWQLDIVTSPDLIMMEKVYEGDWWVKSECDEETLIVIVPISGGRSEARIAGEDVEAPPGTALLAPMPILQKLISRCRPQLSNVTFLFRGSIVKRVLATMFVQTPLSRLELEPVFDLTKGAGATFKLLADTIANGMAGDRVLERSPNAMVLLTDAALRLVLEHVPHRHSLRMRGQLMAIRPSHVEAAVEFMHTNLHKPITVTDIAQSAGTSARSLQASFRQYRGTTPIAYLRAIRLDAVRAELLHPENRLPVKEVALKWGFSHLGRFAAQYRQAFGEQPSRTARMAMW